MHRLVTTFLLLGFLPVWVQAQASPQTVALVGARVIDGTGRAPIENAVVLITGGKIQMVGKNGAVPIPKQTREINASGKTLMPALVDLHTHLGQSINGLDPASDAYNEENLRTQLARLLAYGVGTVAVMGTDRDLIYTLREEQRAGKLTGAHFFTAGRGFGMKGGFPAGSSMNWDVYRPATAEEARRDVRELAAQHPDFVKLWLDDGYGRMPKMPPEIYGAIIDEAHRHKLRVLAHVYYLADAKGLPAAGVDALAHSVRDQAVDRELIEGMKARNTIYLATLVRDESTFAYADGPAWLGDPFFQEGLLPGVLEKLQSTAFREHSAASPDLANNRASLAMAERNLKTLYEAAVRVGFGTDAGPPGRFLGYFEHRELQLMVESGLTPIQAITCATHNAAGFLGTDFGTIEPSKRADFLLLDANPLADIRNTEKLAAVWEGGKPIKPIAD
jgi:imidazolonepropionase-like amidohydrolase